MKEINHFVLTRNELFQSDIYDYKELDCHDCHGWQRNYYPAKEKPIVICLELLRDYKKGDILEMVIYPKFEPRM